MRVTTVAGTKPWPSRKSNEFSIMPACSHLEQFYIVHKLGYCCNGSRMQESFEHVLRCRYGMVNSELLAYEPAIAEAQTYVYFLPTPTN